MDYFYFHNEGRRKSRDVIEVLRQLALYDLQREIIRVEYMMDNEQDEEEVMLALSHIEELKIKMDYLKYAYNPANNADEYYY